MSAVDHDERRQKIAEVAFDLIAREGLEAATIRRIAAEVGYSTTIITHYFVGKEELLAWAYRMLVDQAHERFLAVVACDPTDLVGGLFVMTAADETSIRFWRVYMAFWERAARNPEFGHQLRQNMNWALGGLGAVMRARGANLADAERMSRLLSALVQGISIQVLVDQHSWSADQIRDALAQGCAALLDPAR